MPGRHTDNAPGRQKDRQTDRQVDPVAIKSNILLLLSQRGVDQSRGTLFFHIYFSAVLSSLSSRRLLRFFSFCFGCFSLFLSVFRLRFLPSFVPAMSADVSGRCASTAGWRPGCAYPCVCWCIQIGLFWFIGSCKHLFVALHGCAYWAENPLPAFTCN